MGGLALQGTEVVVVVVVVKGSEIVENQID